MPIGSDQIITQVAVRHGTWMLPSSPTLATTETTSGSSNSRYLGSSGPCASAAVTAMPQRATEIDASLDLSLVQSAYGAYARAPNSPIARRAGAKTHASATSSTLTGNGAAAANWRERVSQPRTASRPGREDCCSADPIS